MKNQNTKKALTFHEKFEKLGSAAIALGLIGTFNKKPLCFELAKTLAFQLELYLSDEEIQKKTLNNLVGLSCSILNESHKAELTEQWSDKIKTKEMTFDEKTEKLSHAVIALALIEMFERQPLNFELVKALALQLQLNLSDDILREFMKFLHDMTHFALHG